MSATVFPPKNTAYTLTGVIKSAVTGNPLTGGLTALAATVSIDGGAFGATTNAPVEIGTSGSFTIVMAAADMNGTSIVPLVTASNANAIYYWTVITTGGLLEIASAVPTSSAVASSVWGYAVPADTSGIPTTMGGFMSRLLSKFSRRQTKVGDVVANYAADNVTQIFQQQFSVTSTGYDRGSDT